MTTVSVIVFPGSNCDQDVFDAIEATPGARAVWLWHKDVGLDDVRAIVLPGGFSYGDYLRVGAVARFSPIMEAVIGFAREGRPVLGICNGFQILTEAGLLPGALTRNAHLRFECRDVYCTVTAEGPFSPPVGSVLRLPIAHGEGRYQASPDVLARLEAEDRIALVYSDASGRVDAGANPNGSARNIAGICNRERNVLGMMPHPERCSESILGNAAGLKVFQSTAASFARV